MRGHSASGQLRTDQFGTDTVRTILPNGCAAMALLLPRQAAAAAPSLAPRNLAPRNIVRSEFEPALPPAFRRQVLARTATGPPAGPPAIWAPNSLCLNDRGQSVAGPAVLIRADRKFPFVLPDTAFRSTALAGPRLPGTPNNRSVGLNRRP